MTYVFVPSYQSVLFILEQFDKDDVTFITYNESLLEFFKKAGINVIFRESQTDLSINGYKAFKKYCLSLVEGWENRNILFCFYTFDYWGLYLLFYLRKKNNVSFYNIDNLKAEGFNDSTSLHFPVANFSVRGLFNKKYRQILFLQVVLYFITGFRIDILSGYENYFFAGVALERCRKIFPRYEKKANQNYFERNKKSILEKYNLKKIIALYIDGGEPNIEISPEIFKLIDSVLKKKNITLFIKAHPTFALKKILEPYEQVERDMPVEFLEDTPVVIGIYSLGLRAFKKNLLTVSLLNLVAFQSAENKERVKHIVTDASNVLIPNTLEELETILNGAITKINP